jgi:hypothetical protein
VPHVTGDRVKDTTTTTGTGNITVSGTAPTGFRTLSTVATADGDTLFLAIVGGAEWEVCLATRVSANVYSRATPLASSNSGSAVSFAAGTKDVFITLPASKIADNTAYASTWDGDTATAPSKNAVHDKFEGIIHPGYVAGNWYLPFITGAHNSSAAGGANTIVYTPTYIPRRITISDLGCLITTASAGGNMKLAIYAHSSSTNRPSGTPLAETGNISTTATGVVSADITGANVTLEAGMYWFAYWADNGTSAIKGFLRDSFSYHSALVGSATQANAMNTSGYGIFCLTSSETYGTWPNATSETFTEQPGFHYTGIPYLKAA